MWNN